MNICHCILISSGENNPGSGHWLTHARLHAFSPLSRTKFEGHISAAHLSSSSFSQLRTKVGWKNHGQKRIEFKACFPITERKNFSAISPVSHAIKVIEKVWVVYGSTSCAFRRICLHALSTCVDTNIKAWHHVSIVNSVPQIWKYELPIGNNMPRKTLGDEKIQKELQHCKRQYPSYSSG